MDPVTEFLGLREEAEKLAANDLRGKQERELQLWKTWKDGGKQQDHLRPLLQSMRPFINSQSNLWATRNRDIPPAAIKAEFTNQFVQALETYDPTKAALNTHIKHRLRKAQRFVTSYQNPARIPETRVYRIRELQDAQTHLDQQFGRTPTQLELADHLKWSPRQVDLLQREVRAARPTSYFMSDPFATSPSRHQEILRLLPYELNPDERAVFEHLYGVGGKPQLEPGQIARTLNMSAPKVSRLKKAIADKYAKYSGG